MKEGPEVTHLRESPANSGAVLPGASSIGMERRKESLDLWSLPEDFPLSLKENLK